MHPLGVVLENEQKRETEMSEEVGDQEIEKRTKKHNLQCNIY